MKIINNRMRKLIIIALVIAGGLTLHAQDAVSFRFSDGIENSYLKTTMERQVSNLLTAINRAETYNMDVNYSGVNIDDLASQSINRMWNNVHMRTRDNYISENCLRVKTSQGALTGYEVRNIAVIMVPTNSDYDEDINQEICIDFDKTGKIIDFNLALEINQWEKIMAGSDTLNDFDKRAQIEHWTMQFRNAYCQKDINFMENVFSDYALVITGKKVRRAERVCVEYNVMDKEEYLDNLRDKFQRYKYINVQFSDIKIERHGGNPNVYCVTLVQDYRGVAYNKKQSYADKGWVVIVWNFEDEFNPKILVRTWQDMNKFSESEVIKVVDLEGVVH